MYTLYFVAKGQEATLLLYVIVYMYTLNHCGFVVC